MDSKSGDPCSEYIFACRRRTEEAFDRANKDALERALCSIGSILSMHIILSIQGAAFFDRRFDAYALLKGALDMLVSALHLARQRANIAVACVLRSALESGCTAVHISTDTDAYTNFTNGEYRSTRSVSAAKRYIPIVGELWGTLSNLAVHINAKTHGPRWRRGEAPDELIGTVDHDFQAIAADPIQDSMSLTLITLIAEIIAKAQELSLLEDDSSHQGWRRVPGTSLIFCSATDKAIDDEWRRFRSVATPNAES
jgi:hypothetical protein